MLSRKHIVRGAAAWAATPLLQACSGSGGDAYDAAVRRTWHAGAGAALEGAALQSELVRQATLAPSSHNTQCWRFLVESNAITVLPDLTRRCPVVDPDDHHLHVSLGCAVENLALAARANGLQALADTGGSHTPGIRLVLERTRALLSPLYLAIPERQCTRSAFDGQPVSNAELALLERAGTGQGVQVLLLTGREAMERVLAQVVQANSAQMREPAFVGELKQWIRFDEGEAERTGDGLFTATTGNPAVPRWLGSALFGMFFSEKEENDKLATQMRSSAGVAVFVSDADDKAHWVEAGRCYERFALQATALGIRNAMLNQPVEVADARPRFAASVGLARGQRPDLVVRFGRGAPMPRSLRRPVSAVLV